MHFRESTKQKWVLHTFTRKSRFMNIHWKKYAFGGKIF